VDHRDRSFGLFQNYRPYGNGVEEVFASVPNAGEYVSRLRLAYGAAYHEEWYRDAYFVVRSPQRLPDSELAALGMELVSGLRYLASLLAQGGQREFDGYLQWVQQTAFDGPDRVVSVSNEDALVHEAVGDFLNSFYVRGDRIEQLGEAYYSIACDYWLGWYLQWPYFSARLHRDVFRPYFELWACGCSCCFRGKRLCLARS
jgi:hypothetical protein